ncbi:hypothetical protein ONR57_20520 [Hoyosella sp. YIM 151337]|uniref:acyl-CoA dehydrogenase family protein n=1 Tax=Hoyosella sp. YIM 151337 TaxID=2992742 RepID=UPI0022364033|nr:acyl-CoA dehydrogenase family protein [Hoyosella sp. YIM 151337]MCW4355695.1 hypothetical protein [Hoyosella sp. YIM 151337]
MSELVLDSVRDLLPGIRERAQRTDEGQTVSSVAVKELNETRLFALLRPREFGGIEGELLTCCTAIKDVAQACGSTGVLAAAFAVTPWRAALLPHEAQEEMWGTAFDTMMSSSVSSSGTITPSPDGYLVRGRWAGIPGCEHADWLVVRGALAGSGETAVLLAPGEYTVISDEPRLGLRGALSRAVVVDSMVGAHRIRVLGSGAGIEHLPPSSAPLYRLPADAVAGAVFASAVIGMAEGAFAEYTMLPRSEPDSHQLVRFAAAASDIDAAWLLITRNLCDIVAHTIAHEDIPEELLLRTRRDHHVALARATTATSVLVESARGAPSQALNVSNPVTRHWRDIHTARAWLPSGSTAELARYSRAVLEDGGLTPVDHTTQHLEEE